MGLKEEELSMRRRLARTLHGGVVQRLSSVAVVLGSDSPLEPPDRRRCARELEAVLVELRVLIGGGLDDPLVDAPPTLAGAVRAACEEHPGLPIEVHDDDADAAVPPEVAVLVRDFVAESVRNAAKHADPGLVTVTVETSDSTARVRVRNDGVVPGGNGGRGRGLSMGLRLLSDDAARLGGHVEARPCGPDGWGTELVLSLEPPKRRFERRPAGGGS
jgi:signal transduction histidine kinase